MTKCQCNECFAAEAVGRESDCILANYLKENTSPDSNVEKNREMLLQRSIVRLAKYGVTTDNNPLSLRAWLQHALEEALDMANYLQAAISKLDNEGN